MHDPVRLIPVIRENIWIVVSHSLGAPAARNFLQNNFCGDTKRLDKTIEEGNQRASRALLELGAQLRVLDEVEGISEELKRNSNLTFGTFVQKDGTERSLDYRRLANKILHSKAFGFPAFEATSDPTITCYPNDSDLWQTAEIRVFDLFMFTSTIA